MNLRARALPPATRVDRAVDTLLADAVPVVDLDIAPLVRAAAAIRAALPLVAPSPLFEERLARTLAVSDGAAIRRLTMRVFGARRGLQRTLVTGAIGSAAVSVAGVTAFAVWRATHRS